MYSNMKINEELEGDKMKRQFPLALLMTLLMAWCVQGDDIVSILDYDTLKVGETTNLDSGQFLFNTGYSVKNANTNGNISINLLITESGTGTDEDSLTVYFRPIYYNPASSSYLIAHDIDRDTVVAYLDWDDGGFYPYPITSVYGPCQGVQVYIDYTENDGANADSLYAIVWITEQ